VAEVYWRNAHRNEQRPPPHAFTFAERGDFVILAWDILCVYSSLPLAALRGPGLWRTGGSPPTRGGAYILCGCPWGRHRCEKVDKVCERRRRPWGWSCVAEQARARGSGLVSVATHDTPASLPGFLSAGNNSVRVAVCVKCTPHTHHYKLVRVAQDAQAICRRGMLISAHTRMNGISDITAVALF